MPDEGGEGLLGRAGQLADPEQDPVLQHLRVRLVGHAADVVDALIVRPCGE
jgi:hypothetical protein